MNVSTAGGLAALIGLVGIIAHAGITLTTALGAGLASTQDDRVSNVSKVLLPTAVSGTPVVLALYGVWKDRSART